jgi:hypothetical protein
VVVYVLVVFVNALINVMMEMLAQVNRAVLP